MGVAIICSALGSKPTLSFEEGVSKLQPGKQQVLIHVAAGGISHVDRLIMTGKYQWRPPLPFVPGGEVAGRVGELGEGCRRLQVGQIVYAASTIGGLASQVVVDESQIFPAPLGLSAAEAAVSVSPFGTAYHALADRGKLEEKESLLVLGASGSVGTAAIQVGRLLKAHVTALSTSPDKMEHLHKSGANKVVLIEETQEKLSESLKKLPPQDVIFDPLGGMYSEIAFRRLAPKGRHLILGFVAGGIPRLPLNLVLLKTAEIRGVFWSRFRRENPSQNRKNFAIISNAFAQKKFKACLAEKIPLQDYESAFERMNNRSRIGKIALIPPPQP